MPTSLNFNGRITSRPGVYTRIVNDLVSGQPAAAGNLAIIGDFSALPTRSAVTFDNRNEFDALVQGLDAELSKLGSLAFSPFGGTGASVSSLTLINYGTSTAAALSSDSHVFTSKLSGSIGDRLALSIVAQADGRNTVKVFQGGVQDPQNRVSMYRNVGLATEDSVASIKATMIGSPVTYDAILLELNVNNLLVKGVQVADDTKVTLGSFPVASSNSLNDVLDQIQALAISDVASWTISFASTDMPLSRLDKVAETNITHPNQLLLKDNAARLVDVLANDAFISAARTSGSQGISAVALTRFSGGAANSGLNSANFQIALDSLKDTAINTLVVFPASAELQALALQHCKDAAAEFGMNRNMWGASSANDVDTAYASHSAALNSELASIVFQGFTEIGGQVYTPSHLAVLLAAMQNSLPAGTPLTKKRVRSAIASMSPAISDNAEIEEILGKGLVAITNFRPIGLSVERSITTWMLDDNPIKSEVSSMASVNQSVRQLRSAVISKIGARITLGMANDLQAAAVKELSQQKADGLIFDFANVEVILSGDTASVTYDVAAAEPLNFITITANIVR